MSQKGSHTWDLVLKYHSCPKCGYIFESRKEFLYRLGKYVKEETCPRCGFTFELTRSGKRPLGPIFGEPTPQEFTWDE